LFTSDKNDTRRTSGANDERPPPECCDWLVEELYPQRHTNFIYFFITVLSFYIMSFLDTFHTFQMLCKYKLETQQ